MIRIISLNDYFASFLFSSCAPTHLCHQLITSFKRPEIWKAYHAVGVHNSNNTYIFKIQTFCYHLSPDKNINFPIFKIIYYLLMSVFAAGCIEIHSEYFCIREIYWKFFFQFFSPESMHKNFGISACRAAFRYISRVSAVMTNKLI